MITFRDLLGLFLKTTGLAQILWGIFALLFFGTMLSFGARSELGPSDWPQLINMAMAIISVLCGLVLVGYSGRLATIVIREDKVMQFSLGADWQGDILRVFVRAVGIVVIAYAIPDLVRQIPRMMFLPSWDTISRELWGEIIAALAKIVIGIHLLCGGRLFFKAVGVFPGESER